MTARVRLRRPVTGQDELRWATQIRDVCESVLGEQSVGAVVMRPTLKNVLAFDIFTTRKWR
jgi:hypothetical protein